MKPKNNRYTYIKYLRSQRAFVQALKPQVLVEPTLNNNVHLNEQQVDLLPQLTNLENTNESVVNELVETKSNEEINIQDVINLEQKINYENNNSQNQDLDNEIFATTLINEQASGINEVSEQKQESPKVSKKHKKQTMAFKVANSRKNFDFEKFEKNVKYKTFKDGTVKKIAAEIDNVRLTFTNPSKPEDRALVLRNTSVQFYEGEVHAIIGESGSGKSVITSLLYGLAGKNANVEEGRILLYNNEVQDFSFKDWEKSRYLGKVISAVFQNPMSTLNPTMKIGKQIMEGMLINGIVKTRKEAYKKSIEYLKLTKINNPEEIMELYPHELSGGMIQRVVIASIVSLHPKILVLDEPTTALDPTVQALVLDVIRELQEKFKMCIIFITHDLGVVASIANYISIMYAGQIIEEGQRDEILWNPQHPYTWGLIMSMPDVNKGDRLATIKGSVPSRLNEIVGDAFAIRNDYALTRDFEHEPEMYYVSETHRVKSALLDERAEEYTPPQIILDKWNSFKQLQENKNNQ
ncbi:ABC transporter ATP-binding protein [Ureaplasma urealyticum]|uniref:ABC transporter ATP-binding protein n=1 Tax=Ureaplasma urealyticum TaxID=2130 RepID=A0AAX1QYN4_UREUR|nr:ABC transporter ATP-binding protein [Ureaplasma urealyticum]QDI63949.1 ABC transporter ATP-binding protein [Ureaplasma urealyticum]RCJ00606.1 ABC transporter ATP-binding protein [Ureaplasma urealyticum]